MRTLRAYTVLATLAAGLALAAAGCTNPFLPAHPEQPSGEGVVENFTTPEKLLETLSAAYRVRGVSGQIAYYDAIGDSTSTTTAGFFAFHAPAVVNAWHADTGIDPPAVWDRDKEKAFFDYLSGRFEGYTYSLVWSVDDLSSLPPQQPDGYDLLRQHYELVATSADETLYQLVAVGYADLYFQKVGARWALTRWEDRVDPDYGVEPVDPDNVSMGARRLESITR